MKSFLNAFPSGSSPPVNLKRTFFKLKVRVFLRAIAKYYLDVEERLGEKALLLAQSLATSLMVRYDRGETFGTASLSAFRRSRNSCCSNWHGRSAVNLEGTS